MRVLHNVDQLPAFRNGILTIGTFDGVHHAHQEIIHRLNTLARERDGESIILTFHPHPRLIINPNDANVKLLTTLEEKIALLEHYGVDNLIVVPFSKEFSLLSPRAYIEEILWKDIHPKVVVIGYDHRFGNNREGDIDLMEQMGKELGFEVEEIERQTVDHISVSSTKIRYSLLNGDIAQATALLGHHYSMEGTVVKGAERGRQLGYPTANIVVDNPNKLVPPIGIYAVKVKYNGIEFGGMLSIGSNPTFNGEEQTIEVNIFDFDEDIYGKKLVLEFIAYLRDEIKFNSADELVSQMHQDKITAKSMLN